jgi:hypothetical protein
MWFPTVPPLHAGPDPAGIHPRILLLGLSLAVATAVVLYLLVGLFGPEDPAAAGAGDPDGEA